MTRLAICGEREREFEGVGKLEEVVFLGRGGADDAGIPVPSLI